MWNGTTSRSDIESSLTAAEWNVCGVSVNRWSEGNETVLGGIVQEVGRGFLVGSQTEVSDGC